jgi:hypothetical protein
MLAAGACALLAVSAAVGYRGWPGLRPDAGSSPELLVAAPAAHKPRRQLAGHPSGAFAAVPRSPHRVLAATEPRTARRADALATESPSTSAPASVPTPAASTSAPAATTTPSTPSTPVTNPVSQGVRTTGQAVGDAVAPVSPTVAQTVTTATGTAGDAVDKATGLLGP